MKHSPALLLALALCAGALLGGLCLHAMQHSYPGYMVLFCASALLRLGTWFVLEKVVGFGPAKAVAMLTSSR